VEDSAMEELKVNALLKEYGEVRQESRIYQILQITCLIVSALIFITMFIAAISLDQFILLFISPLFSMFFIVLAIGMQVYNTSLGFRSSQIEDLLKNIIGEPTIQWESTVGIFVRAGGDILNTQIGRYWVAICILAIAVGMMPILISLFFGFQNFHNEAGIFAWLVLALNGAAVSATLYIGYSFFFRKSWEQLKLSI
jgi:drug/metabolite transporter (DMT)-like permease